MKMGQGVRTGLGHRGITCVVQTQFSSFTIFKKGNNLSDFVFASLDNKADPN